MSESVVRSQSGRVLQHRIVQGASSFTSSYSYDGAGRLVKAVIPGHALTYGFAATGGCGPNVAAGASGNRTSVSDVWTAPGQAARTTTTTYCYDWADRLLSSTVTGAVAGAHAVADGVAAAELGYDARGNTVRLADMTLRYDAADAHSGTTYADGTTVAVVRDALGRIAARTTDPAGAEPAVTVRYLYAGDGDEPFAQLEGSVLVRQVELPGGATVTLTGTGAGTERQWQYPSMLGHTVTTGDGSAGSPVRLYDPYGQPLEAGTFALGTVAADDAGTTAGRTGWHQGAQRIADTAGTVTVIEMGARLYVPALGRFLQVDPVEGGVDNDYVWPTDPIGKSDTDGQFDWDVAFAVADVVSLGLMFVPGIGTAVGVAVRAITVAARLVHATVQLTRGMSIASRIATARQSTHIALQATRHARGGRVGGLVRGTSQPTILGSQRAANVAGRALVRRGPAGTARHSSRHVIYAPRSGYTFRQYPSAGYAVIGRSGSSRGLHVRW
ncbi:hypothetical protein FQ330_00475 [Agrococcus sediminis]|uniref:RHS repeat protein n=1 Tax=Agrococcus sediminis TaxID=2599924 RepID=A0A5M8QNM0_9MICO|nr:hypothetical protein FQ330_00475 [Agrococcus sediminis]